MRTPSLLFFLLLCCFSCGKKTVSGTTATAGTARSKAAKVIKSIEANAVTSQYLEARAKVDLRSEKLNVGGTATIRLERDKAIWISVKKFGFEGARALITQDSFFLNNRLNGDYEAGPLSDIERRFKVPARFDLLQEIVMGNPVFFTRDLTLSTAENDYVLEGKDQRFATRYRVEAGNYRLREMQLDELAQQRKLRVFNSAYQDFEGLNQAFATNRRVEIDGQSAGDASVELDFTRLEFDGPLAMPFNKR